MKKIFFSSSLIALGLLLITGCAAVKPVPAEKPEERNWTPAEINCVLSDVDPWEGFNRAMFSVNNFGMFYLVRPLGWVYGSIFPRPAIKCIANVSRNLEFPARAISALCQAKWHDSGVDFLRFLTNSSLGIGGLFDPAEHWFDLYPRQETFGQAFECWGMGSGYTLTLPLCTTNNVRDTSGLLFDKLLDVKTYLPYGASTFAGVNDAVDTYRPYVRLVKGNADPYQLYKEFAVINRRLLQEDWLLKARLAALEKQKTMAGAATVKKDAPPAIPPYIKGKVIRLEEFYPESPAADTVRAVMFKPQTAEDYWWSHLSLWNRDFSNTAEVREIPARRQGGEALQYAFWRSPLAGQFNRAPLAIVLPGIGTHYTGVAAEALAEVLQQQGFAVLLLSSAFCWDYYDSQLTGALPGYAPADAAALRLSLQSILRDLGGLKESKRFTPETVNIVGYSLGALHSLHIAALEEKKELLHVNRYVAINPPANLLYALLQIDGCSSLAIGQAENDVRKSAVEAFGTAMLAVNRQQQFFAPHPPVAEADKKASGGALSGEMYRTNLSEMQAKLMIAMTFRYTLRDIMMQALRDRRINIDGMEYQKSQRTELYRKLDRITFNRYVTELLLPTMGGKRSVAEVNYNAGLYSLEPLLRDNPRIHVLHNLNDFLLSDKDREYLDRTLGNKITWFDQGGHLGNLYYRKVHQEIIAKLQKISEKEVKKLK